MTRIHRRCVAIRALGFSFLACALINGAQSQPVEAGNGQEADSQAPGTPMEVIIRESRAIGTGNESYLERKQPKYPPIAKRFNVQGRLEAAVLVNREGRPLKATILRREPFYTHMFDEAVRRSLMESRYQSDLPAEGQKAIWLRAPFRFLLDANESATDARLVKLATPELPPQAAEQGVEGWVAVAVTVDEKGKPDMERTHVLGRSPAYFSAFDAKAREAVQKSEFKSATLNGSPSLGAMLLRVDFKIPIE